MLTPELKAQATMAYNNWKFRLAGQYPGLTEEEFISMVSNLQSRHFGGLISRQQFDAQLGEVLKNPSTAIEILQVSPPQKSTDSLLRELDQLHKSKILSDEEYLDRKSELMFQRNASPEEASGQTVNYEKEERKRRLLTYLETLRSENILSSIEFESFKARI